MRCPIGAGVCVFVGIALFSSGDAFGQVPDKFENLQVLSRDITRDSFLAVMGDFAGALGVQCNHCHSGGDPVTLKGVAFKSDEKPAKVRAREMYRLTADINKLFTERAAGRTSSVAVQCITCHRGVPLPKTLQAVLAETVTKDGMAAAIRQYRELRERLLARGRYDFGEASLNEMARELLQSSRREDALAVLLLNKEFYPDAPTLNFRLAELYLERGDRDKAIELYRLVVSKQPQNQTAQRRLDELTKAR